MSHFVEQYTEYMDKIGVKLVQKWYNKYRKTSKTKNKQDERGTAPRTKERFIMIQIVKRASNEQIGFAMELQNQLTNAGIECGQEMYTRNYLWEIGKEAVTEYIDNLQSTIDNNMMKIKVTPRSYMAIMQSLLGGYHTLYENEVGNILSVSIVEQIQQATENMRAEGFEINNSKDLPETFGRQISSWLMNSQDLEDDRNNHPNLFQIAEFLRKEKVKGSFDFNGGWSPSGAMKQKADMKQQLSWDEVCKIAYDQSEEFWAYWVMTPDMFKENVRMSNSSSKLVNTKEVIERILGINKAEDKSRDESYGIRNKQIINKQGQEAIAYYIQIASECNALDNKDDDLIRAIQEEGLAGYEKTLGGEIADMLNTYPTDTPRKKLKEKAPLEIQEFITLKRNRIPKKA